ncbi:MAG: hypothetical protein KA371_08820 [Acidobacteria bacterium]|nr:hypothetical protein [Acidobacteriota bacterium]
MSIVRIALVSVVCLGALVFLGPARAATAEALAAEKYFGCPAGYTFQTSGSAARCYAAGTTSTENIVCGFGYVKAIDQFNGGKDGCQSKMNVVANYTCPNGFSPKVRPGPDVCTKAASPSIIAPTVEKSL